MACLWHGWDYDPVTGKAPGYDDGVEAFPGHITWSASNMRLSRLLGMLLLIISVAGCATRIWNQPLQSDNQDSYFFSNHLPQHNSRETFVVLAFSGGGTRSAAFSYGLLKKLRDTRITIDGESRSLLSEVDVISSVSGGSYTAAYYGLYGARIFDDYERVFLRTDIEGKLFALMYNPGNLLSLGSADYNRGDMAARWLGDNIFENATFADMSKGELPYVILNASDLNTGMTFSFIQQQFDFLCSNINEYPVAHAVMASSAVPVLFGPITLETHAGGCKQKDRLWNSWVSQSLQSDSILDRRYQVARSLERYYDPERMPLIRLVDGGVTDNLGIRGSIVSPVAHYGNVREMKGAFNADDLKRIKRVLVIVVNAQTYVTHAWSERGADPGIIDTLDASFSAAIGILNTETISLAKNAFDGWGDFLNAKRGSSEQKVSIYFVTLTFNQIPDPAEREYFNAIPTTFDLADNDIDAVRDLAGQLLDDSTEFRNFIDSLND